TLQAADFKAAVRIRGEDETGVEEEPTTGDRLACLRFEQTAAESAALFQADRDRLRHAAGGDLDPPVPRVPFAALYAEPRRNRPSAGVKIQHERALRIVDSFVPLQRSVGEFRRPHNR